MSEGRIVTDPGRRYERFKECLGIGAHKRVFKAYDTHTGLEVAWNQVHLSQNPQRDASKVLAEIRMLQRLKNDGIISINDSWLGKNEEGEWELFFITELMTSGTLSSYIRHPRLNTSVDVLKSWSVKILRALDYLHSMDPPVIHRDLKCENVFINGNNGQIKIGDLGIAVAKTHEYLTTVIGTPEFMAPELYDESYDEKADIYAFGMVVLELFTRERPYSECENSAQIYKKVLNGVPPRSLLSIADKQVRDFVMICIDPIPSNRPPAKELINYEFLGSANALCAEICPECRRELPAPTGRLMQNDATDDGPPPIAYTSFVARVAAPGSVSDGRIAMVISCFIDGIPDKDVKFPYNPSADAPGTLVSEMIQERLIHPQNADLLFDCLSKFLASPISSYQAAVASSNSSPADSTVRSEGFASSGKCTSSPSNSRTVPRSDPESFAVSSPTTSTNNPLTNDTCVDSNSYAIASARFSDIAAPENILCGEPQSEVPVCRRSKSTSYAPIKLGATTSISSPDPALHSSAPSDGSSINSTLSLTKRKLRKYFNAILGGRTSSDKLSPWSARWSRLRIFPS